MTSFRLSSMDTIFVFKPSHFDTIPNYRDHSMTFIFVLKFRNANGRWVIWALRELYRSDMFRSWFPFSIPAFRQAQWPRYSFLIPVISTALNGLDIRFQTRSFRLRSMTSVFVFKSARFDWRSMTSVSTSLNEHEIWKRKPEWGIERIPRSEARSMSKSQTRRGTPFWWFDLMIEVWCRIVFSFPHF